MSTHWAAAIIVGTSTQIGMERKPVNPVMATEQLSRLFGTFFSISRFNYD